MATGANPTSEFLRHTHNAHEPTQPNQCYTFSTWHPPNHNPTRTPPPLTTRMAQPHRRPATQALRRTTTQLPAFILTHRQHRAFACSSRTARTATTHVSRRLQRHCPRRQHNSEQIDPRNPRHGSAPLLGWCPGNGGYGWQGSCG